MCVQYYRSMCHNSFGGVFVIFMSLLKFVICDFSHCNYTLIFMSSFVLAFFYIFKKSPQKLWASGFTKPKSVSVRQS